MNEAQDPPFYFPVDRVAAYFMSLAARATPGKTRLFSGGSLH